MLKIISLKFCVSGLDCVDPNLILGFIEFESHGKCAREIEGERSSMAATFLVESVEDGQ